MQQNPIFPPEIMAFLGIIIIVAIAVLVIVLIIYIFYFLTLMKALNRCAPQNRLMEPAMVWLGLVPCVNIVWQFFIATQVPGSLKNEFSYRNRDDGSDYGRSIAMTQAVLSIVNIPVSLVSNALEKNAPEASLAVSGVSLVMSLIGFVCFIVFWVKIAGYSSMLAAEGDRPFRDPRLDDFDDDDDRDGPRAGVGPGGSSDAYKEGDPGRYR